MQNKVRGINNEKRFLREKPSKLFSFFPKRKQATRTHQKKTIIAWDPNVRLSVCASILPPPERKKERKKGGQEILCMRRKKKKFINSSIYPQHTTMVRDEINRPDTTKTHTITKNWRGKSKPTRNGSERKGCRWVWKEALVSNLHRRRKTKKKGKKEGANHKLG